MNIAVRLFISSMVFAIVIAVLYGFTTHDVIGIVFLGIMALALAIVAVYITIAEREANLASDSRDTEPADVVGENMGRFTTESSLPILAALGTTAFLCALIAFPEYALVSLFVGAVIAALAAHRLVR